MTYTTNIDIARAALEKGNWLIRTDREGTSVDASGFVWSPVGEWTTAPDWDPTTRFGHGLYGQSQKYSGYNPPGGSRVVFCDYAGEAVGFEGEEGEVKVEAARVLLVNDLSALTGLTVERSLSLAGCTGLVSLTLPEGFRVGESLYLYNCTALEKLTLPEDMMVGGSLCLAGCRSLTSLTVPESVMSLSLAGCRSLTSLTLPKIMEVEGDLDLSGCAGLTSLTLPERLTVRGNLDISGCTGLTSLTLPKTIKVEGTLDLHDCTFLRYLVLPDGLRVRLLAVWRP